MAYTAETALHRLRVLYRDAHHCDADSDALVLKWAGDENTLTTWATAQIRYRGWGFQVTAATVNEARKLYRRASQLRVDWPQITYSEWCGEWAPQQTSRTNYGF